MRRALVPSLSTYDPNPRGAKHNGCMATRHPPTPETWALVMLGILGVLTLITLAFYFLGAITLGKLLWILLMLVLGVLSVGLRYLSNAGPPAK